MSGVRTCWVLIFALTWLVGLANGLVAYILFGGVCVAVKTYYAVFKDNKYVRDSVLNGTSLLQEKMKEGYSLSNACTIALLDADTGIILSHTVRETCDGVAIEGVEPNAVIKFLRTDASGGEDAWEPSRGGDNMWVAYNVSDLSKDLDFDFPFDEFENSCNGYVLSYDDEWDLRIMRDFTSAEENDGLVDVSGADIVLTRELRAEGSPIMLFNYQLVKKDEDWRVATLDKEIKLCDLLKCYCETVIKLQNRARLLGVEHESDACSALIVKALQQRFANAAIKDFADVSCDFGMLMHKDIDYFEWEEGEGQHLSLCFNITPSLMRELSIHGMSFQLMLLRKRGKKQTEEFAEIFKGYKVWNRYI